MPRMFAAALLSACLAVAAPQAAQANPGFHPCTIMLGDTTADPLAEAERQIASAGCAAGDPLVLVGSGFQPRLLAAALCRPGAGVQISEMPGLAGAEAQLDCEYPGRRRFRAAPR